MSMHGFIKQIIVSLAVAGLPLAVFHPDTAHGLGGILTTKHNLSVSGPGEIKATKEDRVCIFCHTPHHASPVTPLWSRPTSSTVYDLYQSSTLIAKPGQPSGASKLCLSCHDGTVALGALYSFDPGTNVIEMAGGITVLPAGRASNLGKELMNDHPISFAYTTDLALQKGQLKTPAELPPQISLEQGQMLQCTSCHNPHRNPYGKFLVMDNAKSALCISCHAITGWGTSGHAANTSIAAAGCGNCHLPHNGNNPQRLLKNKAEEQNCLPCHQNGGSGNDIQTQLTKAYTHPVSLKTGTHDEAEDPLAATKHVECEDCHNPHRSKSAPALPPNVNGSLLGVKGITSANTVITQSSYEYEICFRCHGDNANKFVGTLTFSRKIDELNTRLDFSTDNPSYHPVIGQGKGINVPSLRPGYTTASMIYCTDCHGGDNSVKAGGAAPNGPHGSIYPHILIARYETEIYSVTNPPAYQESYYTLCYRCHDQNILLDPARSAFPKHQFHVVGKGILCSVCHDPHGVSSLRGGTGIANAHLINFDIRYVTSGTGYNSSARTCDVSCHSSAHPAY